MPYTIRPAFRRSWRRKALGLSLLAAQAIAASSAAQTGMSSETTSDASKSLAEAAQETTFVDIVTVAATRSEHTLEGTPGHVDVISAEEIEELGHTGVADLLRYMPGVFLDGDPTRLGANGFNIRGVGGNRVQTRIDGVPTAEQFDFGPLSAPQFQLDVDLLESMEVVRSAGSALYGSDALGGVVALTTRGPRSYLDGRSQAFRLRAGYDGRADELSESLVYALGNDRRQGSIVWTRRDGEELDNQGEIDTLDSTRTAPNPIDRRQDNVLIKLSHSPALGALLGITLEGFESRTDTQVLSSRAPASPAASAVLDFGAVDYQERRRAIIEHSLLPRTRLADSLIWRAYWQQAETHQVTDELRESSLGVTQREGLLRFDQETFGLEAEVRKGLDRRGRRSLTYGLLLRRDRFDVLRDRSEFVIETGLPAPTSLIFPTKYFPRSDIDEIGLFVQGDLELLNGRLRLVPGLRFDRFELDPDQDDTIFQSGNPGQPETAALTDQVVSPKLGLVLAMGDSISFFAQYAHGFRAPPMSAVNNGFTNQAGGYRTLPNPDLRPETSNNLELGLRARFARGSLSATLFSNRYDHFIETVVLGFNPVDFLVEFQPRNLENVEISGVELAGDMRFGRSWRLRFAYSYTEGNDVTADEPLDTIAPPTLVLGLRYTRPGGRWGIEGSPRWTGSKSADDLPADSTQFRVPSAEVLDLSAWITLTERVSLQLSAWNLGNATYWQWPYARGRLEGSPTLDRYTSPGRSFGIQTQVRF